LPAGDGRIAEVLALCGFSRIGEIWFTLRFRGTITIAAASCAECSPPRDPAWAKFKSWGSKNEKRRHGQQRWERGRRRTRQDQISLGQKIPVKLRIRGSAPNEENLFLLPDRSWESEPFQTAIRPLT
jgi:hypothetical protein